MYGRFGGLTGDISLTYGRHMRRKPQKRTPEVAVFAGDVPYISEMFPYEKQNLPYITQIDRLAWGIARSDLARLHAAATAGERCVVLRLSFVLAAERGMSRMVPRWVVLR